MHDIKYIRSQQKSFDSALEKRGMPQASFQVLRLDEAYRQVLSNLQVYQQQRNEIAKQMSEKSIAANLRKKLIQEGTQVKQAMLDLEKEAAALKEKIFQYLAELPNMPDETVPLGQSEEDNVILRVEGEIPQFSFEPLSHVDLGEKSGLINFEEAATVSGSRFSFLKGEIAILERALSQFMVDLHTQEFGYTLVSPPLLVTQPTMFGVGQLPKFAEEAFQTRDGRWLIPTAEVPLTALAANQMIDAEKLPMRLTACTPCFRSEAGAAGRDTRGLIRQHQFHKVELVTLTTPEDSVREHERMLEAAETVLKRLGLAYRVVLLCTGDLGFSSQKTYDLEVWLPSQKTYREISSCSNCGNFQALRMNARYKVRNSDLKPGFLHTLNGSGVAVGRALVAVMENYQNEDGSIKIPEVLAPYMNGKKVIGGQYEK